MWVVVPSSYSCTGICVKDGVGWVAGFNYDWYLEDGLIMTNNRGISKMAIAPDEGTSKESLARWTSKYGSVTFTQYGREFSASGMNEAGLFIASLALQQTKWPASDSRPLLTQSQWVQYQLDNSRTVQEIIDSDRQVRINFNGFVGLHFIACDKSGECVTVEGLEGKMVYHRQKSLPVKVLTNTAYEECIRSTNQGKATRQDHYQSIPRFMQAAERLKEADRQVPKSARDFAFETLRQVGFYNEMSPTIFNPATEWSVVYDLANLRVFFRTYANPKIRFFNLSAFDFSCASPVKTFDIKSVSTGDVSKRFVDYSLQLNRNLIRKTWKNTLGLSQYPDAVLEWLAQYPESFVCSK